MSQDSGKYSAVEKAEVQKQLEIFERFIRGIANNKTAATAMKKNLGISGTPLERVALQDVLEVFEELVGQIRRHEKSFDVSDAPIRIYQEIIGVVEDTIPSREDALKRLRINTAERTDIFQVPAVPSYLRILQMITPPLKWGDEYTVTMTEQWCRIIKRLALLFQPANPELKLPETEIAEITTELLVSQFEKAFAGNTLTPKFNADAQPQLNIMGITDILKKSLETFGDNITAQSQSTPPVLGLDNMAEIITSNLINQNTPRSLTVGASGVGKSALTRAVAARIASGDVPLDLKDAVVIRLNLRKMESELGQSQKPDPVAGQQMSYAVYAERLSYILAETAKHNANGGQQIILAIDEFDDMLKGHVPYLRGTKEIIEYSIAQHKGLRLIGEMSQSVYNGLSNKSDPLLASFRQVKLKGFSIEETIPVIREAAARLQTARNIKISEDMVIQIVKAVARHKDKTALVKNCLDVLYDSVSWAEVKNDKALSKDHMAEILARETGKPKEMISISADERIQTLAAALPKAIIDQPDVLQIASSLRVANAGLNDENRPLGSYIFMGPTGVGKTETAKFIAEHLGIPLITIDMANFKQAHTVSRLIGSPAGYIGHEEPPKLEEVRQSPYSVVLFDEIEKAHNDVFNILLSILDEGRVQLHNGNDISFKNCIVLMSSNVGQTEVDAVAQGSIGFSKTDSAIATRNARLEALRERFSPEFIGRLDKVIEYRKLTKETVGHITINKLNKFSEILRDKNTNIHLELSEQALSEIITLGFDKDYGGRPLNNAIKNYIKDPVGQWWLDNAESITTPTTLHVTEVKEKFGFELRKGAPAFKMAA